jgi:glycosyltransferase involved in cell wall biosynthesis
MTVISVNRKNENKSSSDIINSKVNIVIVGTLNFPRGSASTSRVTAYGKGIIENGGNVTIICLKPIGIRAAGDKEIPPVGVVNGCKYLYPSGITIRPESFIKRKYFEIKGFLNLLGIIWKLNHSHRIDTILYYGYDVFNQFLLAIWTHLLQIPIIEERCEYPFFDQSTMIRKLRAFIYEKFVIRFFDGMLIMTRALENRYRPLMRKSAKYIMVPILVDISRFENISNSDIYEKYIAYCGDPSGNKDGVPILIEAFSLIAQKHPDVKLYIIGGSHRRDVLPSLREKAEKLNIGDRVVFTGKVNPE